jgi:hypothetical protein
MSQLFMEVSLPGETATDIPLKFCAEAGNNLKFANRILRLFRGIAGGIRQAQVDVLAGATQASGTLTLASVVSTNTCVVGLVTYTADTDFAVGASDTITAANLAAAINADANQAGIVTATSANAIVTVKALPAGKIGNTIILTGSANITASGAHLASGANGTKRTFTYAV